MCAADIAALSYTCRAVFAAVRSAWNLIVSPDVVAAVRSRDEHGQQPWRMLVLNQPRIAPAFGMQLWDFTEPRSTHDALATAKWWAVVALPDGQRALLQVVCGRVTACVSVREWRAKRCAHVQIDDDVRIASSGAATATTTATVTRAGATVACVTILKLFLITTTHESSAKRHTAAIAAAAAVAAPPTVAAAVLLYRKPNAQPDVIKSAR
jgi:hypothetical protein